MEVPFVWSLLPSDNASSGSSSSGSTSVPVPQHDEQPVSVVAPHWNGFLIPARWKIEKKMTGVVKIDNKYYGEVSSGFVRTPYPNDTKTFAGVTKKAANTQGPCAPSIELNTEGFDLTVNFDLDGDGYVHSTHGSDPAPSFFRNSGIYIYGAYEIQIFDTESMLAATGDYKVNYDNNGKTFKFANGSTQEDEKGCVSGIPYKQPPTSIQYDFISANGVRKWIKTTGNSMTIMARRLAGTITMPNGLQLPQIRVKVILNGTTTWLGNLSAFTGTNNNQYGDGTIWLQAHWGSGVKFTNYSIAKNNSSI